MIYLLLLLIPIAAVLIWAVKVDRRRRRRENTGHDVNAAARTAKRDAQRRSSEWGAGM
jgi:cytochrome c-type biogenesis protein CcmH/NrfF